MKKKKRLLPLGLLAVFVVAGYQPPQGSPKLHTAALNGIRSHGSSIVNSTQKVLQNRVGEEDVTTGDSDSWL